MSFEFPEARILATQLDETTKGKAVKSYDLKDYEKLQSIGFINRNIDDFKQLIGKQIKGAESSGNTIRVRLEASMNLLLAPEYGGIILYHRRNTEEKYHLQLRFTDGASLNIRLTSMGLIYVARDEQLPSLYMFKRDYLSAPSPIDVSIQQFRELIAGRKTQLKPVIVGKAAIVTGLSNSAFQDIMWRAGLHPSRRASELNPDEVDALYTAIQFLIQERLQLGGKDEFIDLSGRRGLYRAKMGPNMKGQNCPRCHASVEKITHGGGQVYFCPGCQK